MQKQVDVAEKMKKKLQTSRNIRTMRKLKRLDEYLKKMDFDVYFEVTKLGVNVTGNPTDKNTSNHRVIEVGFKD
jgi:hypothetical protein